MEDRFEMLRSTQKLYYNDQYLMSSFASVVRIHSGAVVLDATVAYPEGGGQEADSGAIEFPEGTMRFVGAKKLYGTPIHLEGFKG
ncbi:alanine--tRNA ligase-related protein, partial [Pseudomonas viridiflava]|uniref:alanine--tRNA ligase-related protein n=1 Tax=Pseudomonas viridiflava TaxID=33069 RepID=UPI001F152583